VEIVSDRLHVNTKKSGDLINITSKVAGALSKSGLKDGNVTVFVIGSTAAITTFEYEPGMIQDVHDLCEKLIPSNRDYRHEETWGDANGFSHLRATLFGQSLVIPFQGGRLALGTWQQVVLAEFDTRPRKREIVIQLIGE